MSAEEWDLVQVMTGWIVGVLTLGGALHFPAPIEQRFGKPWGWVAFWVILATGVTCTALLFSSVSP